LIEFPDTVEEFSRSGDPHAKGAVEAGVRSAIWVAIVKEGVTVGAFVIGRSVIGTFSDKQIALLQNFAAQAVIAMENARLLNEQREALEQQTATAEVLQVINSSPGDLAPVFDAMLEKAMRLCAADAGVLATYDGEGAWTAAHRGVDDFPKGPFRHHPETGGGRLVRGEDIVHILDSASGTPVGARDPGRLAILEAGARTQLTAALRKEGRLLGHFTIWRREVRPFADRQIALLQNFAAQAAIAMENARLLDELRQRQEELRITFENMGDGVVMFDANHRLAAWNRNFQELLDIADEVLAERPDYADYLRLLAERGEFGTGDVEAELARRLRDTDRELRLERIRPDGRIIEVRRNAVPDGGFVLIYSDITERKRSESEIRAARDAAEAAYRDLKAAQASLIQAEKMASLGQLTAGIAHEIKNPLNFVNNFATLSVDLLDELKQTAAPGLATLDEARRAEVDDLTSTLASNLDKINEHGRRADGIVRSMLEHSRGSSGERRSVDLNALVDEALNLAYHGARAQDQSFSINLRREFGEGIAPITLAPQDITRALLNLFSNGFYAARRRQSMEVGAGFEPTLRVTTRELGDAGEIKVRDNGVGIPEEVKDKLFQPFFTTKPTGEGTGLGLSITYDIVTQEHGGSITVDSKVGEYTEFTIRLPRNP
jgi:signal transduction histidine kinase